MSFLAALLALVGSVVFSFVDPTIDESSGLVDLGELMVTTNDSGGDPLVFVVDAKSVRANVPVSCVTDVMSIRPVPVFSSVSWIVAGPGSMSTPPKSTVIPGVTATAGPTLV